MSPQVRLAKVELDSNGMPPRVERIGQSELAWAWAQDGAINARAMSHEL